MNSFRRRLPMIFQAETAECGLACLAMVARYHGIDVTLPVLRELHGASLLGLSLRQVLRIADAIGLQGQAVQCDMTDLALLRLPAMLHWDFQHFVVLKKVTRRGCVIHDPGRGLRMVPMQELSRHFTGIAVQFERLELLSVPPQAERSGRSSIRELLGDLKSFARSSGAVLMLSVGLEAALLIQPILIRWVVDHGLQTTVAMAVNGAIGVALLAATLQAALMFCRDRLVLNTGTAMNARIMDRLFRHILRLPLSYFEKRPIGHLIERYRAADEIERLVISTIPLGLLDGLVTLISLIVMLAISAQLAAIGFTTFILYALLRWMYYSESKTRAEGLAFAKGEESGFLIETLRSIFTTKANALELNRHHSWKGFYSHLIRAQQDYGNIESTLRAARLGLLGFNLAAFLYVAARQVQTNELTIGTLLAVLVYNGHFLARSTALVDRVVEIGLLAVKARRLEDIVLAQPEVEPALPVPAAKPVVAATIRVEKICFSYGPNERPVFKDLSFNVSAGEFVAIVGDNGSGKTTLLKLLIGLYRHEAGAILVNGRPLEAYPVSQLRWEIGVVTQSDVLLNGTVAENICLFEPEMNFERVKEVCDIACIRAEIESSPMGYQTRVGGMGSPFSAGQTQRLFLARALYREPSLLLLDEGTANIDATHEAQVLANLRRLPCTKILIAHHASSIAAADRILKLGSGTMQNLDRGEGAPGPLGSLASAQLLPITHSPENV
jgi:ATP-binding cassette subfamily B protein RaxB